MSADDDLFVVWSRTVRQTTWHPQVVSGPVDAERVVRNLRKVHHGMGGVEAFVKRYREVEDDPKLLHTSETPAEAIDAIERELVAKL